MASKHDIIEKNLRTLARARSFNKAVEGWTVKRVFVLGKGPQQACELCGTHFRTGARIQHSRTGATVIVGGTCLRTILTRRFPVTFAFEEQRQQTLTYLRNAYNSLVDPGNWTRWIVENSPPRLAQSVAEDRAITPVLLRRCIRCRERRLGMLERNHVARANALRLHAPHGGNPSGKLECELPTVDGFVAGLWTADILIMMGDEPRPRASSEARQALTVAFMKPGCGSAP